MWRLSRTLGDLDDDGIGDQLEAEESSGSLATFTRARVTFSGGSPPIEATSETWASSIVNVDSVPSELVSGRHESARAAIEDVLFPRVCDQADPSLAWLLEEPKRLHWMVGAPVLPTHYTVRWARARLERTDVGGEVWISYLGGVHRSATELAADADVVLLGTAHGVIVTDAKRSRHAWLYVHPGGEKLRWRSIEGAEIRGKRAIIRLRAEPGSDLPGGVVDVDLESGAIAPESSADR